MVKKFYQLVIKDQAKAFPMDLLKVGKQGVKPEPLYHIQEFKLSNGKDVKIGSELSTSIKQSIIDVLSKHTDTFASKASKIVIMYPEIVSHNLNIDPAIK